MIRIKQSIVLVFFLVLLLNIVYVFVDLFIKDNINKVLKIVFDKYKGLQEGKNVDYILVLVKVDFFIYGIVLIIIDGKVYMVGDIKFEVLIQFILKVFILVMVMD